MEIFGKIRKLFADPLSVEGILPGLLPDRLFVRLNWKRHLGSRLNLKHPVTFNEKLQWLKLYDRNPLYTALVDKVAVKDWVAEKIGRDCVIPTIAVWNSADDIDFDVLPDSFVLKASHDSGTVVICRDKSCFDREETKFDFFDMEFNHLPFTNGHPNAAVLPAKPCNFELMKRLAGTLSAGIPHVRVDFYEIGDKVYFGEMTFSTGADLSRSSRRSGIAFSARGLHFPKRK